MSIFRYFSLNDFNTVFPYMFYYFSYTLFIIINIKFVFHPKNRIDVNLSICSKSDEQKKIWIKALVIDQNYWKMYENSEVDVKKNKWLGIIFFTIISINRSVSLSKTELLWANELTDTILLPFPVLMNR